MARAQLLSQDWYRVADLRPRLRAQIEVALHEYLGTRWYVLLDRASGKTHRLAEAGWAIVQRFNGRETLDEIWTGLARANDPDLPPQDEFIELMSRLYDSGIVAVEGVPKAEALAKSQAKKESAVWRALLKSPVSQKIPLYNPAPWLDGEAAGRFARFVFSWAGLAVLLTLMGMAGLELIRNWEALTGNLADRALAPNNLVILVCVYPVVKLLHELAHALAVRRFGGQVTETGIMFLIFVPMPYVDASAANYFRAHGSRALVAVAGILAELGIGALAIMMWAETDPGLLRAILFNVIVITTISTLFFNGNPLLRFDAYYALADLTQTPNLGNRGQALIGRWFKRLFGYPPEPETETAGPSSRAWMASYAAAAFCYRVFVTFSIALIVTDKVPYVGQVLAIWIVGTGLVWPNAQAAWRNLRSPAFNTRRRSIVPRLLAFFAVLAALIFFVPLPSSTTVRAVVASGEEAAVFSGSEGRLVEIVAEEGARVAAGDLLLRLAPDRLETEVLALDAQVAAREAELRIAQGRSDGALASAISREIAALEAARADLQDKVAAAELRAGRAGILVWDTPEPTLGELILRGSRVAFVDRPESRRLLAMLPEGAGRNIERGITEARFITDAAPGAPRLAEEVEIMPNASRALIDPRLADRSGGPILTAPDETNPDAVRATAPHFWLEADGDFADLALGDQVQLKLVHPWEPLFPRVVQPLLREGLRRFGPG